MKIILASEFDISFPKTKPLIQAAKNNNVVFIPTASYGEGFEPAYDEHIKPFEDMGMQVTQFDLKDKTEEETREVMKEAGLIYGGPGNTFYLLQYIKSSGFGDILREELNNGCIYLGSSAGSVIASPDISFISPMDDPSRANLDDTKGLALINFLFLPHRDHPEMGQDAEKIIQNHDSKDIDLLVLNDDQAIFIEDNIVSLV